MELIRQKTKRRNGTGIRKGIGLSMRMKARKRKIGETIMNGYLVTWNPPGFTG